MPRRALVPARPPLEATTKLAIEALDGRAEAKGARQSVSNDIDEWKEGIHSLRTTTYAELLKLSAAKGYSTSWVESFFRQASSARVKEGQEPGPKGGEPQTAPLAL